MNITDISKIKTWFQKGKFPTQEHFYAWMDSFWHKNETLPTSSVAMLDELLSSKADNQQYLSHIGDYDNPHQVNKIDVGLGMVDNVKQASSAEFLEHCKNNEIHELSTLDTVAQRGNATILPLFIGAAQQEEQATTLAQVRKYCTSVLQVSLEELAKRVDGAEASVTLKSLSERIQTIINVLQCGDTTLDTIQEITNFIKNNQNVVDGLITGKLNKAEFDQWVTNIYTPFTQQFNNHAHQWTDILGKPSYFPPSTHTHTTADLPAYPTLSTLGASPSGHNHDGIYIKTFIEQDPTVPAWAKMPNKPSYSAAEVGAATSEHTHGMASSGASGLMSAPDKQKLDGIDAGAEVNIQADWNVSDSNSDSYIKNKPAIFPPESHNHPASTIIENANYRFVSEVEKTNWNNKASKELVSNIAPGLMSISDKTKLDTLGAIGGNRKQFGAGTNVALDNPVLQEGGAYYRLIEAQGDIRVFFPNVPNTRAPDTITVRQGTAVEVSVFFYAGLYVWTASEPLKIN